MGEDCNCNKTLKQQLDVAQVGIKYAIDMILDDHPEMALETLNKTLGLISPIKKAAVITYGQVEIE